MQFTTEGYCYAEYQEREVQESSSGTMNSCTKKAQRVNRMTAEKFFAPVRSFRGAQNPPD